MLFNPSITEVHRRCGRNDLSDQSLVMGRVGELHNCRGSWGASEVSRLITLCVVSLAFLIFHCVFDFSHVFLLFFGTNMLVSKTREKCDRITQRETNTTNFVYITFRIG